MELSIDTASALASIAISDGDRLVAELTWRCHRNHTIELLPSIRRLLSQAGSAKEDLTAVFVCTGPGMYTGLRVGISTAQGLAYALRIPALGVGRLELDACPHAAFPGPIVAIHKAGRGDLAWASYRGAPWRELSPPRLSKPDELARRVRTRTLFAGEIDDALAAVLRETARGRAVIVSPAASVRHAAALAELGFERLSQGQGGDPALLRPVYLRPPAISPKRSGG